MLQPRSNLHAALALALIACLFTTAAHGQGVQNIDASQPILRTSPLNNQADGYFGYQVVLHQTAAAVGDRDTALEMAKIIVSAPRGTHPSAGSVMNTGLIFECPVNPGICTGLMRDSSGANDRLYDSAGNDANEDKEGQFLGISLASSGDSFVACAHRYVNINGDDYNPFGRCFHSGRSLSDFIEYQPCNGVGQRATFSVGVCQAGTSSSIAVTDTASGTTAIGLGAPGVYTWRGIVIRRSPTGASNFEAFGEATEQFALQGYSMTKGNLLTIDREDFAVSVPRRNFYFGTVNIVTNTDQLSVVSQPLQGTQIGEYYGYALAAADLTGDGLDELLVGAPLYSDETVGAETGRVYVYRNVGGSLQFATQLLGVEAYSRFGHAITNLGDVNDDGFDDVAISAPFGSGAGTVYIYHGSPNQVISAQAQQNITGANISTAVNGEISDLKGFGASLASGVDVDLNTYNDLVIGSYDSQAVFLLRTRPVATLSTTLEATPNPVVVDSLACSLDGSDFACFTLQICTTLSGRGLDTDLSVTFTLTSERRNLVLGLQSRIFFESAVTQPATTSFDRTVQIEDAECFPVTAYIKENVVDIFNAFSIDLEVSTAEIPTDPSWTGNGMPIDLSDYPIAFISGTSQIQVETFKDCGGGVCIPDLRVTVGDVMYRSSTNQIPEKLTAGFVSELTIPLTISNEGNDAYAAQLQFNLPNGILEFIRIDPPTEFVTCISEVLLELQETRLICDIGNPFSDSDSKELSVILSAGASLVGDEGMIGLSFNASSINDEAVGTISDNQATIDLEVDAQADVFLDDPGLVSPQQLSYAPGIPEGEVIANVTQLGPRLSVSFVVRNAGPSTIPVAEITINWPLHILPIEDPISYLLYPFSVAASSGGSVSCNTTFINPLGLTEPNDNNFGQEGGNTGSTGAGGGKRKRRRRRAVPRKLPTRQATTETVTPTEDRTLSCDSGLMCVPITCEILQLVGGANTELEVTAYLDERSFVNEVDRFTIIPTAGVSIKDADYIVQPQNQVTSETASAEVRLIPAISAVSTRSESSIEWWVIALPIILGLLFILVVGGILWGVGFFRRRKHEEIKQKREELEALNGPPGGE